MSDKDGELLHEGIKQANVAVFVSTLTSSVSNALVDLYAFMNSNPSQDAKNEKLKDIQAHLYSLAHINTLVTLSTVTIFSRVDRRDIVNTLNFTTETLMQIASKLKVEEEN